LLAPFGFAHAHTFQAGSGVLSAGYPGGTLLE
jgi:hypothetical protein